MDYMRIIKNDGRSIYLQVPSLPSGPPPPIIMGETPTGLVNGSNATYITAFAFDPSSVVVSINGVELKRVAHFNTTGTTTITLGDSPTTGETITVSYIKA